MPTLSSWRIFVSTFLFFENISFGGCLVVEPFLGISSGWDEGKGGGEGHGAGGWCCQFFAFNCCFKCFRLRCKMKLASLRKWHTSRDIWKSVICVGQLSLNVNVISITILFIPYTHISFIHSIHTYISLVLHIYAFTYLLLTLIYSSSAVTSITQNWLSRTSCCKNWWAWNLLRSRRLRSTLTRSEWRVSIDP